MPITEKLHAKTKTKEELTAEVTPGSIRLDRDTKVLALELGYSDVLREPGETFTVKKGTIYKPGYTWFTPVDENTPTTEETDKYDHMTVGELKIALAKTNTDFNGVTRKADLIDLLIKAQAADDLA